MGRHNDDSSVVTVSFDDGNHKGAGLSQKKLEQLAAARAPPEVARTTVAAPSSTTAGQAPPLPTPHASLAGFEPARPEEVYLADIDRVFEALRDGDSYEVCLTTQVRRCTVASTSRPSPAAFELNRVPSPVRQMHRAAPPPPPLALYSRLRRINPAPYAAFLRIDPHRHDASAAAPDPSEGGPAVEEPLRDELGSGGFAVCCSSPERFLRLAADGAVESKPIKGTAPRGATPASDAQIRESLLTSEKDRAENLMIVDLIRNDLGRVCELGSVDVPSLMAIESYATACAPVGRIHRMHRRPAAAALGPVVLQRPSGAKSMHCWHAGAPAGVHRARQTGTHTRRA